MSIGQQVLGAIDLMLFPFLKAALKSKESCCYTSTEKELRNQDRNYHK